MIVHNAGQPNRSGLKPLIEKAVAICSTIKIFWADGGYSGKPLFNWVKMSFQKILEIVKRPTEEFKVVQWRWIVERTLGWFNRYRRLSKDYEVLPKNIAMINILVHWLKPG